MKVMFQYLARGPRRPLWTSRGEQIPHFFDRTAIEEVRRGLCQLGEEDLALQSGFIRAAIASTGERVPHPSSPCGPHLTCNGNPQSMASFVGDALCRVAFESELYASWIGLTRVRSREISWSLQPLDMDFYDGISECSFFLAYLGGLTRDDSYSKIARKSINLVRRKLERQRSSGLSIRIPGGYSARAVGSKARCNAESGQKRIDFRQASVYDHRALRAWFAHAISRSRGSNEESNLWPSSSNNGETMTTSIHSAMPSQKQRFRRVGILLVLCNLGFAQTINPDQAASIRESSPQRLTLLESLQSTLANQPELQIAQQQVEISRALKQQASGQFDTALEGSFSQAHTNSPLTQAERALLLAEGFRPISNLAQNLSVFNVTVAKLYRTGIQVSPLYQTTRTTDNLSNAEGTNVSSLAFQILIPLLKGRGRAVVAAPETAADIEISAALLDLNQTISSLLATTASSYWNAVAAARQVEVARSAEQRGRTYVDNVQTLIQADRLAKSEINQAIANLADRTANRVAAEQTMIQAEQQLALAMGLDLAQIQRATFSFEDFPEPATQRLPAVDADVIQKYVEQTLTRRADYLAAQRRVEESRVQVIAARNGLKPRLDLSFSAGSTGLSEGTAPAQFFNSGYRLVQGLDATGAVTYNFPFRNDLAIGQLRQAQASLMQAQLRVVDLGRQVSSAVVSAYNAVQNAATQLESAHESVKFSQAALEGERQKFSLGFNSLVDVLTVEDRLTTAMTSEVNDELGYAAALTQLRSSTGTIVDPYKEVHSVDRDIFFVLP